MIENNEIYSMYESKKIYIWRVHLKINKISLSEGSGNYPYMIFTFYLWVMHYQHFLMDFSELMSQTVSAALYLLSPGWKPNCVDQSTSKTINTNAHSLFTQIYGRNIIVFIQVTQGQIATFLWIRKIWWPWQKNT